MPREDGKLGLPAKPFFYSPEQIAGLLEVKTEYVMQSLLWYEGRSVGYLPKDKLRAINVAPVGETPVWRIPERSLLIFLRYKGIKYYTRGL